MAKLGVALTTAWTGEPEGKDRTEMQDRDTDNIGQSVKPHAFKSLIGKDHPEFSSARQQAGPYITKRWVWILRKIPFEIDWTCNLSWLLATMPSAFSACRGTGLSEVYWTGCLGIFPVPAGFHGQGWKDFQQPVRPSFWPLHCFGLWVWLGDKSAVLRVQPGQL